MGGKSESTSTSSGAARSTGMSTMTSSLRASPSTWIPRTGQGGAGNDGEGMMVQGARQSYPIRYLEKLFGRDLTRILIGFCERMIAEGKKRSEGAVGVGDDMIGAGPISSSVGLCSREGSGARGMTRSSGAAGTFSPSGTSGVGSGFYEMSGGDEMKERGERNSGRTKVNSRRFSAEIIEVLKGWYEWKKMVSQSRLAGGGGSTGGEGGSEEKQGMVMAVYITKEEKSVICGLTGLTNTQLTNWVSNQRNRDGDKERYKREHNWGKKTEKEGKQTGAGKEDGEVRGWNGDVVGCDECEDGVGDEVGDSGMGTAIPLMDGSSAGLAEGIDVWDESETMCMNEFPGLYSYSSSGPFDAEPFVSGVSSCELGGMEEAREGWNEVWAEYGDMSCGSTWKA